MKCIELCKLTYGFEHVAWRLMSTEISILKHEYRLVSPIIVTKSNGRTLCVCECSGFMPSVAIRNMYRTLTFTYVCVQFRLH